MKTSRYEDFILSNGVWHFKYASDFFEVASEGELTSPLRWQGKKRASRKTDRNHGLDWSGTANYDEANKLAKFGWPEGTQRAMKLAEKLSAELVETLARPAIAYDVEGDMFDMGRVIDDEPECWMKWEDGSDVSEIKDSGKGPIKLVLNSTVSSGISKEIIEIRGCAMMALCTIFEAAMRPVMVEIVCPIIDRNIKETSVVLKDYYDPMQIDVMAYCLIHPSFFRRHIFAVEEVMNINDQWGYGIPTDTVRDKGDIYIGEAKYGNSEWQNAETAEKWIRQQLENQGIRFHSK